MKLITDSTVDLPKALIEKYQIAIVPLKLQLGENTYQDYFELSPDEYYQKLKTTPFYPKTTQPSPLDFEKIYQSYADEQNCLFSIHLSSKLSGTYQSALIARQKFPQAKIHVIDSQQASVGLGTIILQVAKAIEAKQNEEKILTLIQNFIPKIKTYFTVDSLEYLQRGGRIGKAQCLLGSMLNIKPLLTLITGEIHPLEKIRGQQKLISRLAQLAQNDAVNAQKLTLSAVCTDNEQVLNQLLEQLDKIKNIEIEYRGKIGGVITSHVGTGALGISLLPQ